MHLSNLKALSSALNAKDYYTLGHAARVSAYMVLLGSRLGWPEERVRGAEEAAYLHDIGKIGISDRVLLKPGKLNAEEWSLMRQHPVFSADIIRTLFEEELVLGVRHHHERWDGGGYPDGLRGEEIPLIARAMCVVDSYDAMSFQRPYRQRSRRRRLPRGAAALQRPAVRPGDHGGLSRGARRARCAPPRRRRRRRSGGGPHRPRQARAPAPAAGRGERGVRRDRRRAARRARCQPADDASDHPGAARPPLRDGRRRRAGSRRTRAHRHRPLPRRGPPGASPGARRHATARQRPVCRPARRVGNRRGADPRRARRRGRRRGRQPAAVRGRPAGRSARRRTGDPGFDPAVGGGALRPQRDRRHRRRSHRPLQPPLPPRPPARGAAAQRGARRAALASVLRPRRVQGVQRQRWATAPATTPCARRRTSSNSRSATSTWPRATAARSSWSRSSGPTPSAPPTLPNASANACTRRGSAPAPSRSRSASAIATFPADARTKEELLDKADWAMNVAKRLGRNRVVTFSSGLLGSPDPPA